MYPVTSRGWSPALLALILTLWAAPVAAMESVQAEGVLQAFLRAMYSRDAAVAYDLIAAADRDVKTEADYRRETGELSGPALALARALAREIRFYDIATEVDGDSATVSFAVELPDANHPDLDALVMDFDGKRLTGLGEEELIRRVGQIGAMAEAGRLPMLSSDREVWSLLRDPEGWRVFLNWAGAVEVRFQAFTLKGLAWEFEPLQERVLAVPGETLQMAYRARNIGDRETTGKARHIVTPDEQVDFMEIVACFCFLEQSLRPGEEAELPLIFRIAYEAPETLRQMTVRYEFYPIDQFPEVAAR